MRRPDAFFASPQRCGYHPPRRSGYTLVEILTATLLMVIIMLAVTVIFASVTESIGQSRATLEMNQRLRSASALLKQDLENVTVAMSPPVHPRDNSGYFEYIEGLIGPVVAPEDVAWNSDNNGLDSTVGDIDDILMLTAKTEGEPYVGLVNGTPTKSNTAEIIWFVRGRTLYRRVLLVKPDANVSGAAPAGFYASNDLSVHKDWNLAGNSFLVPNTLADLTRPECRFAHHPDPRIWTGPQPTTGASPNTRVAQERRPHPFFYRPWLGSFLSATTPWVPGLGLPILAECSAPNWAAGEGLPINNPPAPWLAAPFTPNIAAPVVASAAYDAWVNPHPWDTVNPLTGAMTNYSGTRIGEDVVLTNVIGFDVKAWDPLAPIVSDVSGAIPLLPGDPGYENTIKLAASPSGVRPNLVVGQGAYVDLNYLAFLGAVNPADPIMRFIPKLTDAGGNPLFTAPLLHGPGSPWSRVYGTLPEYAVSKITSEFYPAVYDTWSLHYEFNKRTMVFAPGGPPVPVGDEDGVLGFDQGSNGIDDDGANGVDDVNERETQPPYAVPLQGIQVKIRTFEPGSRQVREVTLVQKFRTR